MSKLLFSVILLFLCKGSYALIPIDSSSAIKDAIRDTGIVHLSNDYLNGKADAKKYYKGYKGAATVTLLSGTCLMLVSPVAGLTSAIACSSTPPKLKYLNLPDTMMKQNEDYMAGYHRQAKKIKQRKVWTNWAIGFGINVSIVGLLLMVPGK